MNSILNWKSRYLQIAFNDDLAQVSRILPTIPRHERIFIEAGTPFIKREGIEGIIAIRGLWPGKIVADLKTTDGAQEEVRMAKEAGAFAVTAAGSAPVETIHRFVDTCNDIGVVSMVDMLGVSEPMRVLVQLKVVPDVVVLHKGRDEESTRGKVIPYKQINKIRSKYDVIISAAGGIDLREARSAVFNGASIVVANVVHSTGPLSGIQSDADAGRIAEQFLQTIS